jgi:hypothetical protein
VDRLDGEVRAAGAAGDEEDVAAFLGDGAVGVVVFSEVWVDVVVEGVDRTSQAFERCRCRSRHRERCRVYGNPPLPGSSPQADRRSHRSRPSQRCLPLCSYRSV